MKINKCSEKVDILVIFRLDLGQVTFKLVEKAFATQQLAFLTTSIAFYHIVTWAYAEIKILAGNFALSFSLNFLGIFVHI